MPSGLRKTTGNHFEIYYEQPWGGVATDRNAVDIGENQLVVQQGAAIINGELSYFTAVANPQLFQLQNKENDDSVVFVMFYYQGSVWVLDQFGNIYQYVYGGFSTVSNFVAAPPDAPWVTSIFATPYAVQVINGQVYISNYDRNSIYTYGLNPAVAYTLASNYTGGKILGVLTDYLLQLNTNSSTDGQQPNRINWSGPGEFSTWNPASNEVAGFNTLASVEDELTGFLSFANVGIAISQKGLVELSPTGVGIGPFNFTPLWTPNVGQGCVFPRTVTQYGQQGYLATDSDVYAVSTGGGFVGIGGSARSSILADLQVANVENADSSNPAFLVAGGVMLNYYNLPYSTPSYVLCAIVPNGGNSSGLTIQDISIWIMDLKTNTWINTRLDVTQLFNNFNGTTIPQGDISVTNINVLAINSALAATSSEVFGASSFDTPLFLIYMNGIASAGAGSGEYSCVLTLNAFNTVSASLVIPNDVFTAGNLNLIFRAEEIKLGYTRKPTLRRAIVKAYGTGTLVLSVTDVTGVVISLGSIILDGTLNPKTYYSPSGISTVEAPQFSITSDNFIGSIIKVMLAGTYADGDID